MELSEEDRLFLCRVMADVLNGVAFFSLGEMTTITGWSEAEAKRFASALNAGHRTLSTAEMRFVGQTLYAWFVSVKKGRIKALDVEVQHAEEFDQRRRARRRSD